MVTEEELSKLKEYLRSDWGDELYFKFFPEDNIPILGE